MRGKKQKELLEMVKFIGTLPGVGEMAKNTARLMDTQDQIEEKLFEIGLRSIDRAPEDDCKMISDVADYFELVLAGIESFEESLTKKEK